MGIEELRTAIEHETDQLPHLRDAFPASWFAIKDYLAGMKENYLSFEQYRQICVDREENDPDAQESLAFHLHNLGIALNYKDDPRLRDLNVLNPHWVTNGIYKILNAETLHKQQGELRLSTLSTILDSKNYLRERHHFLLDLMCKFKLCFRFPNGQNRYLIPDLLDKQEPEEAGMFKQQECLNFQYHYPVLPEGLLPRFIVYSHILSQGLPRWRTGVVLEFEGNKALVKADVQDKKVLISVKGPRERRRQLLAIIRSDFEYIHQTSFRFEAQEMVPVPEHPETLIPYKKLRALELKGIEKLVEVIDDEVLELNVQDLLEGVDLADEGPPVRLFYSYSHKDEALRDELETHLKLLERKNRIRFWHDRRIQAGDEWEGKIDENLEKADIILLLVSADFIASDYCWKIEMKRALERHEAGEARVIPVILRNCNWHDAPFGKLNALPIDGQAVTLWPDRDSAWTDVAEGIRKVVKEIRPEEGTR